MSLLHPVIPAGADFPNVRRHRRLRRWNDRHSRHDRQPRNDLISRYNRHSLTPPLVFSLQAVSIVAELSLLAHAARESVSPQRPSHRWRLSAAAGRVSGLATGLLQTGPFPACDLLPRKVAPMSKWPIGVFTSIDAGLGVHLDVVQELEIPTIQIHAPHGATRTAAAAKDFLAKAQGRRHPGDLRLRRLRRRKLRRHSDTARTVGLVPESTRAARTQGDEGNLRLREAARLRQSSACTSASSRTTARVARTRSLLDVHPRPARPRRRRTASRCTSKPARKRPTTCWSSSTTSIARTCSSTSTRPT